ncbi:MAG: alpha/beta hydrolase domain-containing protein [Gemmatimonadota bacterium]
MTFGYTRRSTASHRARPHRRLGLSAIAIAVAFTGCQDPILPTEVTTPQASLVAAAPAGQFVEVGEAEAFGRFLGRDYVRITGRFEGTTSAGEYRVPFEIVVPEHAHDGNGTVLIEPPHFAQRFSGRDDYLGQDFLFNRGYRWASVGWSTFAQSVLDPEATDVEIPGGQDDEIVVQFVNALKHSHEGAQLLGKAHRFYGFGFSQTSWLMHRLLRSEHGPGLFDFTMLAATWWQGGGFQGEYTPVTGVGKVMIVQAEADLVISDGRVLRAAADRPSTYRVYEVAGAAHIPDIPENYDNPVFGPGIEGTNPVDWSIIARAAFVAGDRWHRWHRSPTASVFLDDDTSGDPDPVYGFPTQIARNADTNALGGVRLPEVELGVWRAQAADPNAQVGFLTGAFEDISCTPAADGSVRFPRRGTYLRDVVRQVRELRRDRLMLHKDAIEAIAYAFASDIGRRGSCPTP